MSVNIGGVLETLASGEDLSGEMAEFAFNELMDGGLSPAQAGAFLMGLRAKGERPSEVAAGVTAALKRARLIQGLEGKRIDTCGTGGDNSCSFNCSTAVALYLAGMGYKVVKHGNRSISSNCGSADAVEDLGLPMPQDPGDVADQLAARNFVFLFAPYYHPAFKHIMPVRKELGMRTLFNLMGPLLNPARPTHQLLGVAKPEIMHLMAEVLLLTGVQKAAVVHGQGGFDELTTFGPSRVVWAGQGGLVETELDPAELGIKSHSAEKVAVAGREQAFAVLRELLQGCGPEPMREMLVLNLAMALHLLEDGLSMGECVEKARKAYSEGAGMKVVNA